jgi:hypothetical protein
MLRRQLLHEICRVCERQMLLPGVGDRRGRSTYLPFDGRLGLRHDLPATAIASGSVARRCFDDRQLRT